MYTVLADRKKRWAVVMVRNEIPVTPFLVAILFIIIIMTIIIVIIIIIIITIIIIAIIVEE